MAEMTFFTFKVKVSRYMAEMTVKGVKKCLISVPAEPLVHLLLHLVHGRFQ